MKSTHHIQITAILHELFNGTAPIETIEKAIKEVNRITTNAMQRAAADAYRQQILSFGESETTPPGTD